MAGPLPFDIPEWPKWLDPSRTINPPAPTVVPSPGTIPGPYLPPGGSTISGPGGAPISQQPPLSDVPTHPGIAPEVEGGESDAEGIELDSYARHLMRQGIGGTMPQPVGVYGAKWGDVGGGEGHDIFNEAFVERPQQMERALGEESRVTQEFGKAKEDYFKRTSEQLQHDLAIQADNRAQHQQELQAKQVEIDKAVTRYSNDLADRGQYWRNPGNILAALGAALIQWGSKESGVGIKIINQAVERDWNQRKQLADMHMGELRSNLANYRQLVGDKEMGDKLALSDAYRVAAMEMERIGAQFQGPLAKAQAEKNTAALMQQAAILRMQVFKSMVLQSPELMDPRKAALLKSGGYSPFGTVGQGSTGQPGGSYNGQGSGVGGVSGSQGTAPQSVKFSMDPKMAAAMEKRAPGSTRALKAVYDNMMESLWIQHRGNPKAFATARESLLKEVDQGVTEIAKASAGQAERLPGLRKLGLDLKNAEIVAKRLGMNIDSAMGAGEDSIFGSASTAKYRDMYNALIAKDPKNRNKYESERAEHEASIQDLKQLLAGERNTYVHAKSGTAVNAKEEERMREAVGGGFRGATAFVNNESMSAEGAMKNALRNGNPLAQTLYKLQVGIGYQKLDRPGIDAPKSKDDKRSETLKKATENLKKK